jgi:uncharacterized protein YkwD
MKILRTFAFTASLLAMSAPTAFASKPSTQMVAKFNKVRAAHGLKPLKEAPRLDRSASRFARRLILTDNFAHGTSFTRTGFRLTGEILELQHGAGSRPAEAFQQWLASPPHLKLILDRSFSYVGVAPALGIFQGAKTTVWVAHFGG